MRDARAGVFVRMIEWAIVMIKCCGLLVCILENVLGIAQSQNDDLIYAFLESLQKACPEFHWDWEVMKTLGYKLPQTRVRVFIKGVRKSVMPHVPKALRQQDFTNFTDAVEPDSPYQWVWFHSTARKHRRMEAEGLASEVACMDCATHGVPMGMDNASREHGHAGDARVLRSKGVQSNAPP